MATTSDHVQRARVLLRGAGMVLPPVPRALRPRFRHRSEWCFSSRPLAWSPYDIRRYVDEALTRPVRDYVLVAHAGRGVNSYAMHYFLVQPPLRLFLQVGWGGVYMDPKETTALVNRCFGLAGTLIEAAGKARERGRLGQGQWLTVIASDFYGGTWWPPGRVPKRDGGRSVQWRGLERNDDPTAILKAAISWCRAKDANQLVLQGIGPNHAMEDGTSSPTVSTVSEGRSARPTAARVVPARRSSSTGSPPGSLSRVGRRDRARQPRASS